LSGNAIKKILVVQIGKIGDMVLTTPLFSKLKELFPNSYLTVLASPVNAEIPIAHKSVDEILVYNKNIPNILALLFKLRRNKYDLWIDSKKEYSSTSAFLLRIANPRKSAGFNSQKKIFDINLNDYLSSDNAEHYIDINLAILKYFGADYSQDIKPNLSIPIKIENDIKLRINYIKGGFILMNISSGNLDRYWNRDNWIDVIEHLKLKSPIIITGDDRDEELLESIYLYCKGRNMYYIKTGSILEFAALIKESCLLITPDTSAVHFASAFDIPIIALYNNVDWNLKRFAPLSTINKVLVSNNSNSINSIEVNEVIKSAEEILNTLS
jgi:ADP-heptose:LPS heptosyltransferase